MSIKEHLEKIASQKACQDEEDFNPQDYAGGNYDDAFALGEDDGEIFLARALLKKFFPET